MDPPPCFQASGSQKLVGLGRTGLPRLVPFLTGSRNRVEAPDLLAGLHVVRRDEAANPVLAATHADDHFVLDDERRVRNRVARRRRRHLRLPDLASAFRVDGNQVRIERPHEQRVTENRDAAVVRATADDAIGVRCVAIDPERAAGDRVERHDVVRPLREVHHAVDHERRGLPVASDRRLIHPLELQVLDVGRRDLVEQAEAVTRVVARVGQPILRLGRRGGEALWRHLAVDGERERAAKGRYAGRDEASCPDHCEDPFRESR